MLQTCKCLHLRNEQPDAFHFLQASPHDFPWCTGSWEGGLGFAIASTAVSRLRSLSPMSGSRSPYCAHSRSEYVVAKHSSQCRTDEGQMAKFIKNNVEFITDHLVAQTQDLQLSSHQLPNSTSALVLLQHPSSHISLPGGEGRPITAPPSPTPTGLLLSAVATPTPSAPPLATRVGEIPCSANCRNRGISNSSSLKVFLTTALSSSSVVDIPGSLPPSAIALSLAKLAPSALLLLRCHCLAGFFLTRPVTQSVTQSVPCVVAANPTNAHTQYSGQCRKLASSSSLFV